MKAKTITVFCDTMESQDRKVRELEAQGYKVVPVKDRKVDDGVTLVLERWDYQAHSRRRVYG